MILCIDNISVHFKLGILNVETKDILQICKSDNTCYAPGTVLSSFHSLGWFRTLSTIRLRILHVQIQKLGVGRIDD